METADKHNLDFDLSPPLGVKGMTVLDRGAFTKTVTPAGILVPKEKIKKLQKAVGNLVLKRIKHLNVLEDDDPLFLTHKVLLFNPLNVKHIEDLSEDLKTQMVDLGVDLKTFGHFNVEVKYDNWDLPTILTAVIPESADKVRGFAITGHIAHLNLRDEHLPYKNLIGQVVLDKNQPQIRTVVNKAAMIDTEFRTFQMELLAGENNFVTTVKESGCSFTLDFSKVYWNSKLGTEHQRMVDKLSPGDLVFDVFAGVGPFAVPAAKKGAVVYANDLNPDCYTYLHDNARQAKKKEGQIFCYNLDGRTFMKTVMREQLLSRWKDAKKKGGSLLSDVHIIMNLPATAIEFLDVLVNLFSSEGISATSMKEAVYVHCYCFGAKKNSDEEVIKRLEGVLQQPLPGDHTIRYVRNVAPHKEMLCVTFKLTQSLLFGEIREDEQPAEKRLKTEESQCI